MQDIPNPLTDDEVADFLRALASLMPKQQEYMATRATAILLHVASSFCQEIALDQSKRQWYFAQNIPGLS